MSTELANLPRPTNIVMNGHTGIAQWGNDSQLLVMFYNRSVEDPAKSLETGRPVHEDKIFIKIQHPGEMYNIIDRPINDLDKMRFRDKWSAFVQNRTQIPEGTPIDLLFPNYPAIAENLRAYGIYTIEQCAKLSASAIDNIGRGGQEYVNRSQKYLDSAQKGIAFHKLQKENDDLKNNLQVQSNQIRQLKEQLDYLLMKVNDPLKASQQPPFIPGYDAQSERINANHPTAEVVRAKKGRKIKSTPTVEERITDPFAGKTLIEDSEGYMGLSSTEGQDAPEA